MKLFMLDASPFARKVRCLAIERSIEDRIESVPVNPHERPAELVEVNPLSKIPTLVTDEGSIHCDSFAICLYLDRLGEAPPLVPLDGANCWPVIQRHVFANGIMECAVIRRMESLKAQEPDRVAWMQRQAETTARALDRFEENIGAFQNNLAIDTLSLACALAYLDFRLPDDNWRRGRPRLAEWFKDFDKRSSMQRTRYPA